jgi:peptidoglycan/LPS O-acetylase OafA/YrhL
MGAPVDLFNGVVAVSPVMLFAKFVTHRTRSTFDAKANRWHEACVFASLGALLFAFIGVTCRGHPWWLAVLSALSLAIAILVLVFDALSDDGKRVEDA